jgi:hypothetical protein
MNTRYFRASLRALAKQSSAPLSVMAGLDPAIHVFLSRRSQGVDHRDKRGDDSFYVEAVWIASLRSQ